MTLKDLFKKTQLFNNRKNEEFGLFFSKKKWLLIIYPIILASFFTVYGITYSYLNDRESKNQENLEKFFETNKFSKLKKTIFVNLKSPYLEFKYNIEFNDSIGRILKKFNVADKEIKIIVNGLKEKKLTNIYAGRTLSIIMKKMDANKNSIVSIKYPVSNTQTVEIRKTKDIFSIKENILNLKKEEVVFSNSINNNLYSAAISAGIEPNIIIEFARIYGFEIDFQRDIRKGDMFEIYYERFIDDKEVVRDTGKIIYAHMNVNNKEINLYNFNYKGDEGYYDISGKSIVKSLMKTPINGARLSSSFGMRKHPILGFNKMHKGTDFAAPTGTPIMASGSGTVTRARWCGGGGNCVKIRHNSTYETIYAHMSKFARGIKEGKKVKQGQTIGYVGSTGLSTGPHLHYEVVVNGKKVNSQKLKLPSGKILKGDEREEFELKRIKIDLKLAELKS